MIYISRVPGLGLIHVGLGLEKFIWPRPHSLWPWPRAKLASLTSLSATRGVLNHRGDNSAWEDALDLQSPSRVNSGIGAFILGIRTAAML